MELFNKRELQTFVDKISKQYFEKPFVDEVVFNNRLRTTGGRYIPSKRVIELNPKYFLEMDQDEFIGIIKHELCHYHLHIEGKGYKHGDQEFKDLLKRTGSPRYCKTLPSQKNRRRHLYTCQSCYMNYYRLKRMNVKKYRCGKCGGKIKYIKQL